MSGSVAVTSFLRRNLFAAIIVSIAVGVLIIAGGVGMLLKNHFDSIVGKQNQLVVAQKSQIVAGCQRLNVKQAQDNRNQYADYVYDRIILVLVAQQTPRKGQSKKQERQLAEFLDPLRVAVHAKAWVPLVPDCMTVGAHYVPPNAIPFYQQRPPRSALHYP